MPSALSVDRCQLSVEKKMKYIVSKTNYENLRVFQLSELLADEIWTIVTNWKYFEKDTVGKQLVRTVDSVGANISEGAGRGSFQDNRCSFFH